METVMKPNAKYYNYETFRDFCGTVNKTKADKNVNCSMVLTAIQVCLAKFGWNLKESKDKRNIAVGKLSDESKMIMDMVLDNTAYVGEEDLKQVCADMIKCIEEEFGVNPNTILYQVKWWN